MIVSKFFFPKKGQLELVRAKNASTPGFMALASVCDWKHSLSNRSYASIYLM